MGNAIVSRLCPRDLFEQFGREGFAIAKPARDLNGLNCCVTNGACMEPVLRAGDVVFYEEGAEPQDGDIIVFDVRLEIVERARSSSPTAKAWEETFGQPWPTRQAKLIKHFAGEWWIVCNESMARRDQYAERIVGVVRAIHRAGVPVHCSGIEPGAATAVYNQTDDTESVTLLAQTVMSIAVPAMITDHVAQVTATFDVWRNSNGAGSRVVFLQQDGSATAYNVRRVDSLADPGERVSLLAEFSQSSGTAFTYELNYLGVNVGDTAEFRNISMRVEIIKR